MIFGVPSITSAGALGGLEHPVFPTELIVGELVTNAARGGGAPVGLRLIRDQRLICEVSDPRR
ncbi:hypothetical protein ACFYMX_15895 [Streptomyces griseofuscus]|uniref:hypothetical protein n=1 Tax=Streptomyces TaxID=1883 RepID=UPI0018F07C02|nr:hypothetical protein [Streptomyces sp. CRPSP2-6A1]MBJ7004963.1 hypothetical protein [Streptomyces sp. CRPSP2-6A1]